MAWRIRDESGTWKVDAVSGGWLWARLGGEMSRGYERSAGEWMADWVVEGGEVEG